MGTTRVSVPCAPFQGGEGASREWHSKALGHYQRRTRRAEALSVSVDLAGVKTRRMERALFSLFQGDVSKDMVRLILDGTAIKTRLHRHLGAGGHRRTT